VELSQLLAYLRSYRLGVLGSLSPHGEPQAALVGYTVTDGLELLFDTVRTSRKYRNMMATPQVSFTIGNTAPAAADERTAQYEGLAEELSGPTLDRLLPIYLATWPECAIHQQWPDICWFVIRPRWIRYTDYDLRLTQEWTF
jgi:hypothetical protein